MKETMKKLTQGATRLLVLALGLGLASTGWAVSKPLAIWNGDFSQGSKRNGYVVNINGNTVSSGYVSLNGSGGGVIFTNNTVTTANSSNPFMIVAGIEGIQYTKNRATQEALVSIYDSGADRACRDRSTFVFWNGRTQLNWYAAYMSDNNGTISEWGATGRHQDSEHAWPNNQDLHYFGASFVVKNSISTKGWRSYIDGTLSSYTESTNSDANDPPRIVYGATIGGTTDGKRLMNNENSNATLKYVAIIRDTSGNTDTDIGYWSLANMTSSATFTDGGTIATGTDYTQTGLNLNGGTITVSGEITAAAIFVQADTTLSMAAGTDKLALTGPVYIADGVALTINVTANPGGYVAGTASDADLITGTLFVANTTIKAGSLPSVSGGKAGIVTETANNKIKWKYTPMPVWNDGAWVGGNTPDENTTEITINSTTSATYGAGGTYDTVYVEGSSTLNIASTLTVDTLNVGAGSTVNMANIAATKVTGSGTVIYDSDSVAPIATDSDWRGTVWFKNRSFNGLNPNTYGNANSVLKFTGVTGWLVNGTTVTVPMELEDDGDTVALTFSYSTEPSDTLTFNKLQGGGTFRTSGTAYPKVNHRVLDWNSFTGSLEIDRGRFVFGSGSYTTEKWRNICIGANASVELNSSATWKSYTGFVVGEGATLMANGTLSCEGANDGDVPNVVSGSGTVVFSGRAPTPTGGKWWSTSGWTGVVEIRNYNFSANIELATYGHSGSKVCMNGSEAYLAVVNNPNHNIGELMIGPSGFTQDGSYSSGTVNITVPCKITGTGTYSFTAGGGAQKTVFLQGDTSGFDGILSVGGSNCRIVLGETSSAFVAASLVVGSGKVLNVTKNTQSITPFAGGLFIDGGGQVTVSGDGFLWTAGGIKVDGKLTAPSLSNFGGGTTITTADNGVFTLTSTGNGDAGEYNTDYSRIAGTGSLKYQGTGWRALSKNKLSTALTIINEQSGDLLLPTAETYNIGSLAGSKNFQGNYGSNERYLNILQSKDTEWSGKVSDDAYSRLAGITINASSTGTLTLSGAATQSVALNVEGGAVNLTGTWKGNTTVAGTIGGTGTLTGNLTFGAGSTFKAFASDADGLSVSGTVTCPESGTVTVDVDALDSPDSDVVLISKSGLDGTKFALKSGSPAGYTLAVEDNALKLKRPANVTVTVPVVANTTVAVTIGGVEQVGVDGDGVKTYSVPYGSAVVVTYAAVSGYQISGTAMYNIASATTDATITVDQDLSSDLIVATFNGTSYTALQVAVDAWAGADAGIAFMNPVVLTADVTENVTIPVNANVAAVPLQMQGSATINGTVAISSGATFQPLATVQFGGDVVVTGTLVRAGVTTLSIGGDLTLADGATLGTTALDVVDPVYAVTGAIEVEGILNISLTSSTLEAGTYKVVTGASVTRDEAADVVVFLNAVENNNWVLNSTSTELNITGAAAMVDGEKFTSFTDAVTAAAGSKTIELLASASYTLSVGEILIVEAGSFTMTVTAPEGYAVAQSGSGVVTYTTQKYVARLQNPQDGTSTYQPAVDYTSLAAAVADVTERSAGYYGGGDAIVTLLDDVALDATLTVSKKMILNMNGKSLTASGFAAINNSTKLTVQGSSGSISVTSGGSVVLTTSGATVTVSAGATLSPTPTTTVANHHVVNNAGVYTVALDQFAVTIPSVANTTVSVSYTSGGVNQVATEAGGISVDYGTSLTATWTAASGYRITANEEQTINSVVAAQTLASPTVEAKGATVSNVAVSYGSDYTSATVTATVSDSTLAYYISWGSGEPVKGTVSDSTVTFDVSGIAHSAPYQSSGYNISAKDGETTVTTTGGSGESVAADVAANWINENATTHGNAVAAGGVWTNAEAVTYSEGKATITDNRFEATTASTASRVVLKFNVCFSSTSDEDVSGEAQAAIKLAEVDSVTTFMVLTNGNNWAAVSNAELTPDASATYNVVLTIDYGTGTYKVDVAGNSMTNSTGSASFSLAANRTSVQNIDFAGSGTLTSLKGDQLEGYMVKDNVGNRYATIEAATQTYNSANGPYTVLHDGTPPSGWKIVEGALIKVAKGLFFMAY